MTMLRVAPLNKDNSPLQCGTRMSWYKRKCPGRYRGKDTKSGGTHQGYR